MIEDDRDLCDRVRSGDRQAMEELFARYMSSVSKMAAHALGTYQDVEDVVGEALLRAARSISSFRWESSFTTWLYKIVSNVAADFAQRAAGARMRCVPLDWMRHPDLAIADVGALGQPEAVEDVAIQCETRDILKRAMLALPSPDRAALWLREVRGMSYQEISAALGCSIESVRGRLKRARKRLRLIILSATPENGRQ
ncbi:MAG: sigma-70 family RNA polymerase sigma factor [Clostridia bacterium]|nr:sigma-70 family RNA polymerase sigma factor [Clostridia bacterium]